ncbi:MAG: DUF5615 family PIN-like protein [Desulfobacterales bacterium]|nr:DUF5615 family PIN-like protein [Desulfobacterales bacterium]
MTINELRQKGHEVIDIRGTDDQGLDDEALWQRVQMQKCVLITTDKGFSIHRDEAHHGILIIRLKQPTLLKIHQRVMQAISRYSEKDWSSLMVVMRDTVQSSWKPRNT